MASPPSSDGGGGRTSRRPLDPHPELWAALEQGELLRRALVDFYDRVFLDERLAPFFVHTTKSWAIDHQYAFLRSLLTGERVYFGDRPRNAHHWMVIDDELFDYREQLIADTFRRNGVPEAAIAELAAIHECFRHHIVKGAPFPRKRGGVALPLDGWDATPLSAGGLCDRCGQVIEIDGVGWYHRRTGETRCGRCADETGVSGAEEALAP